MTQVDDSFSDPLGHLNTDSVNPTWDPDLADASVTAFLNYSNQKHVDLLDFFSPRFAPRDMTDLDLLTMDTLDSLDMDEVGQKTLFANATYAAITGTNCLSVLKHTQPLHSNWRGATVWVKAANFAISLDQSNIDDPLGYPSNDISGMANLVIPFPNVNADIYFDQSNSYVQLTSDPAGNVLGSAAAYQSAIVDFSSSSTTGHTLTLALSDFSSGAGASFDLSRVHGVLVHLQGVGAAGDRISMLSVRATGSAWSYWQNGVDTAIQALTIPPTIDGQPPSPTTNPIPIMRGTTAEGPQPIDTTLSTVFNTGNTGSYYDQLTLLPSQSTIRMAGQSNLFDAVSIESVASPTTPEGNAISPTNDLQFPFGLSEGLQSTSDTQTFEMVACPNYNSASTKIRTNGLPAEGYTGYNRRIVGFNLGSSLATASSLLPMSLAISNTGTISTNFTSADGSSSIQAGIYGRLTYDGTDYKLHSCASVTVAGVTSTTDVPVTISALSSGHDYWLETELSEWTHNVRLYSTDPITGSATVVATNTNDWNTMLSAAQKSIIITNSFAIKSEGRIQWTPTDTLSYLKSYRAENTPLGGELSTGSVALYFREGVNDSGTNAWQRGILTWQSGKATFHCEYTNDSSGATTVVGTKDIDPLEYASEWDFGHGRYMLRITLHGTAMSFELLKLDGAGAIVETTATWSQSDIGLNATSGRVGLLFAPQAYYDSYLEDFAGSASTYGYMETQVFPFRTPVDGAQLLADYSPDVNLFRSASAINTYESALDPAKTFSGNGSFGTKHGIYTNKFEVVDWNHLYLNMDIWVPASSTRATQPEVVFVSSEGETTMQLPLLLPASWNHVEIELDNLVGIQTGILYYIKIIPPPSVVTPQEFFVDVNLGIMQRLIDWQLRTSPDNVYRSFRGMVNKPDGALRFDNTERGTQVQLRAVVLSPDAWIGENNQLVCHTAEPGNFIFDQAYETVFSVS